MRLITGISVNVILRDPVTHSRESKVQEFDLWLNWMSMSFPLFNTPSNDSGLSHFLFLVIMNLIKTGHTLKRKINIDLAFMWLQIQKKPKENQPHNNQDPEIIYLSKSKSLVHICRLGLQACIWICTDMFPSLLRACYISRSVCPT